MTQQINASEVRFTSWAPQRIAQSTGSARLERFPHTAYDAVRGQVGPLANLRSASGCGIGFLTDSPCVEVHLEALRHHQMVSSGLALEVRRADGGWDCFPSRDLREVSGAVTVRLATGLERGKEPREAWLWLPVISTCAVTGLTVPDGAVFEPAPVPEPRWLAIGDSLTQGFSVQNPVDCWVHRLMRRWEMPVWNLGVGGAKIVPGLFDWALRARHWELVTIGLGSNHAWNDADLATVVPAARELAELALAGGHQRLVWLLPPWKPLEEGKGPPDFMGVPLDAAAAARVREIRERLRESLASYAPRIEVVEDLAPHEPRLYPDGLHPFALGMARYAQNLADALRPATGH
jgi:lysophospholipase L1-like esterase